MANLVELVKQTLLYGNLDKRALDAHVTSVVNQHQLRQQLYGLGLVAFVANGSILPRESGAGARSMTGGVVSFKFPKELELTIKLADGSTIRGMGIARGITVITGVGFNGKSTLLEALELGVYDHIPGDGRELVVADPTAVKIRAQDGRIVTDTDISLFLGSLPGGKDAMCFSTENASGSTSMAANIAEALEVGCKTLLIDADSSATNLLVRDERMQILIQHEPTAPLISVARALYDNHGVSTVLVVGGPRDWLAVADQVILMDSYVPSLVTKEAREIVRLRASNVVENDVYATNGSRSVALRGIGEFDTRKASTTSIPIETAKRDIVHDSSRAPSEVNLHSIDQLVERGRAKSVSSWLEHLAN
nr:hypothetical protein B0A51_02697 [Rachicladosporium sp. CCFEE 5018]